MRAITVEPVPAGPDGQPAVDEKGRPLRPGPESLKLVEVPDLHPGPGEVLVDTLAVGVNRADLLQRQGLYPPPPGTSEVIGLEAAGRVAALGEGVTGWQVGDEVVALLAGGGYATQFVAPAGQLVRPPHGMDLITAASLIEVAATVVSNMDHVRLQPGETLLIHGGTGGIGVFAIQYAKALGCTVATTAGTPEKVALCRDYGADIALDYHDDWVAELKQASQGHGADVILDIMGGKYLEPNVAALAMDGRCVIIGMQGGAKGTLNIGQLLNKRATVTATGLRFRPTEQKAAICAQVAEQVWPMYESGQIQPAPIERFELAQADQAQARLESGQSHGKLVLVV